MCELNWRQSGRVSDMWRHIISLVPAWTISRLLHEVVTAELAASKEQLAKRVAEDCR